MQNKIMVKKKTNYNHNNEKNQRNLKINESH